MCEPWLTAWAAMRPAKMGSTVLASIRRLPCCMPLACGEGGGQCALVWRQSKQRREAKDERRGTVGEKTHLKMPSVPA